MTTITWAIEWMQCKPVDGPFVDVVVTAGWRCKGTDQGYASDVYGSCAFAAPEESFTPYEQLTQEQVLGWCWAGMVDKDEVEAAVQAQLDKLINPPVVLLPLPWAA